MARRLPQTTSEQKLSMPQAAPTARSQFSSFFVAVSFVIGTLSFTSHRYQRVVAQESGQEAA